MSVVARHTLRSVSARAAAAPTTLPQIRRELRITCGRTPSLFRLCCVVVNAVPHPPGNRGRRHATVVLFILEALVSALFFPTTVFGIAVGTTDHPAMVAQPKGLNISNQGNVDGKAVVANRVFLFYAKTTEGIGKVMIGSSRRVLTPRSGPHELVFLPSVHWCYKGRSHRSGYHLTLPDRSSGATRRSGQLVRLQRLPSDGTNLQDALDIECTDRVFNLLDPPTERPSLVGQITHMEPLVIV